MYHRPVTTLLLLVALCLSAGRSVAQIAATRATTSAPATNTLTLNQQEREFLELINNYRRQNGITTPLEVSLALTKAAKWHSASMGSDRYFSHNDNQGRTFTKRMEEFGYTHGGLRAENITAGQATAATAFDQWKNSSGHNENMLNPAFRVIGIAFVHTPGSPYGYYWTTTFGAHFDQTLALNAPAPPSATPTPM